jgi:hypothetical protein
VSYIVDVLTLGAIIVLAFVAGIVTAIYMGWSRPKKEPESRIVTPP